MKEEMVSGTAVRSNTKSQVFTSSSINTKKEKEMMNYVKQKSTEQNRLSIILPDDTISIRDNANKSIFGRSTYTKGGSFPKLLGIANEDTRKKEDHVKQTLLATTSQISTKETQLETMLPSNKLMNNTDNKENEKSIPDSNVENTCFSDSSILTGNKYDVTNTLSGFNPNIQTNQSKDLTTQSPSAVDNSTEQTDAG